VAIGALIETSCAGSSVTGPRHDPREGCYMLRAVDLMRSGAPLVQMHTREGLRCYVVPGGQVSARIARELLACPDVQPSQDGLFPGISQTFRLRRAAP